MSGAIHCDSGRIGRWTRATALGMLLTMAACPALTADTIIMRTGEKFTSDQILDQGDTLRFNLQGLIVTVHKEDVAAVIPDQPSADAAPGAPPRPVPEAPPDPAPAVQPGHPSSSPQAPVPPPAPDPSPAEHPAPVAAVRGTGLKGLEWNMRPDQIDGLIRSGTDPQDPEIELYQRPAALSFGQARLDGMVCGFWQDRLYAIMMWVDGPKGYDDLARTVFSIYGQGNPSGIGHPRHIWSDALSDRMLEFDNNVGIFWMRSRALEQRRKQYP